MSHRSGISTKFFIWNSIGMAPWQIPASACVSRGIGKTTLIPVLDQHRSPYLGNQARLYHWINHCILREFRTSHCFCCSHPTPRMNYHFRYFLHHCHLPRNNIHLNQCPGNRYHLTGHHSHMVISFATSARICNLSCIIFAKKRWFFAIAFHFIRAEVLMRMKASFSTVWNNG